MATATIAATAAGAKSPRGIKSGSGSSWSLPALTASGDVLLQLPQDNTVVAHKAILSVWSPVLAEALQAKFERDGQGKILLPLKDDVEAWQLALPFMYPVMPAAKIKSLEDAEQLLLLADKYNMQPLMPRVVEFVLETLQQFPQLQDAVSGGQARHMSRGGDADLYMAISQRQSSATVHRRSGDVLDDAATTQIFWKWLQLGSRCGLDTVVDLCIKVIGTPGHASAATVDMMAGLQPKDYHKLLQAVANRPAQQLRPQGY
jgi:hypothetical protein